MVFQKLCYCPQLTVQNGNWVGSSGNTREDRRKQSPQNVDLVGLDGFENAYLRRFIWRNGAWQVGFARAFVLEPRGLFMDEGISVALDVLTSCGMREIVVLWNAGTFPSQSIDCHP
jgi:NitT/TauT family transport system ATP-binding protein